MFNNREYLIKEKESFNKTLLSKLISSRTVSTKVDTFRLLEFILKKTHLAKTIYEFLWALCENNPKNSEILYDLTPNFQYHLFFMPEAIHLLKNVLKKNEEILYRLGHSPINLVGIDKKKKKEGPKSVMNVVINIVDTSNKGKGDVNISNLQRQNKLVDN